MSSLKWSLKPSYRLSLQYLNFLSWKLFLLAETTLFLGSCFINPFVELFSLKLGCNVPSCPSCRLRLTLREKWKEIESSLTYFRPPALTDSYPGAAFYTLTNLNKAGNPLVADRKVKDTFKIRVRLLWIPLVDDIYLKSSAAVEDKVWRDFWRMLKLSLVGQKF